MVQAPRGRSNHKQQNKGVGIQLRAGNGDKRSEFLPIVKDMETGSVVDASAQFIANSQKVQNSRGHLINIPSILPAT